MGWRRQFAEPVYYLGRRRSGPGGVISGDDNAFGSFQRLPLFQPCQNFQKHALALTNNAAVGVQPPHPAVWRNREPGAAQNQRAVESLPHDSRQFLHVFEIRTRREGPAIVEIANAKRHGLKFVRFQRLLQCALRRKRHSQIQKLHLMTGGLGGGGNAQRAQRRDRIR